MEISIKSNPSESFLNELEVSSWPIWEKEASSFPWTYDMKEECYILEGEVTVTPNGGEAVQIKAGDFVTFPAGMSCQWQITQAIRKHYRFL
ncbi:MAG TPA: DUF861 domain-containing protein [Thiomicrospira sp.]|nr:DUF861 domain-containing protein [Thiomicrospira sp.]